MESTTNCGEAARAAGQILRLIDGGCRNTLRAELRRVRRRAGSPDSDRGEAERWELLEAIAQDASPRPSPAAVSLLRHLAAGRRIPPAAPARLLQ